MGQLQGRQGPHHSHPAPLRKDGYQRPRLSRLQAEAIKDIWKRRDEINKLPPEQKQKQPKSTPVGPATGQHNRISRT